MPALDLAALVDIDMAAEQLGMPAALAREYFDNRYDYPVATYRGRPLWLSETVHDALTEREQSAALCRVVPAEEFLAEEFLAEEFLAEPGQVSA